MNELLALTLELMRLARMPPPQAPSIWHPPTKREFSYLQKLIAIADNPVLSVGERAQELYLHLRKDKGFARWARRFTRGPRQRRVLLTYLYLARNTP
ncbi:hypothetical protein D6833_07330 [Candidatus Parcubacteria bacterium]|nr:MAG: hypothetical protein D6833_07330 [Candidatus Parcubacteria bacterium]